MTQLHVRRTTACLTILALAACSGDIPDVSGGVQGLSAPAGVNLVEPDTANVSTDSSNPPASSAAFGASSDFVTDAASVRLFDNSLGAIQTANSILCEVGLTQLAFFTNRPAFKAQVDLALCGNGPAPNPSDGEEVSLRMFTLETDRANNLEAQTANFWLPLTDDDIETVIIGSIIVNSAPTESDPYGDFSLTYAVVPDGGTIDDPDSFGVIASAEGENGFRFVEGSGDVSAAADNAGDEARLVRAVISRDSDGVGSALISETLRSNDGSGDSGQVVTDWRVAFDEAHVLRQLGTDPEVLLSRTDFTDNVFSYNLYHNEGADRGERVELNSAVIVELSGGLYGSVGYFGASAEDGASLTDGTQVTAVDGTPYTVVEAPGRLMKYTSQSVLLTELGMQIFELWDDGRFQVDYFNGSFRKVAEQLSGEEEFTEINPPTVIDVAAAGGFLSMWSSFLGPVNYVDGDLSITYALKELVTGSSDIFTLATNGNITLYGTFDSLKSEISLAEVNSGDIYLPPPPNISSAYQFIINQDELTLRHAVGGDPGMLELVGLASGVVPTEGPNVSGLRSGRLVLQDAFAGMSNPSDVFDETVYYVYETGHNSFNQLVALQGASGEFVDFDAPIEFLYVHSTSNDINGDATFAGQQTLLTYSDAGRLSGIPKTLRDVDGDGQLDKLVPNFSIGDGTILGPSGTEYVLRAIGVEQTLTPDPGAVTTLDLSSADALTLPPITLYSAPDVGTEPNVTGPPRVIDGEVQ